MSSHPWRLVILESAFQHYDGYSVRGRLVKGCHNIYRFIELVQSGKVVVGAMTSDRRHLPMGVVHVLYKVTQRDTRTKPGNLRRSVRPPSDASEDYEPKTLTEANIWTRDTLSIAVREAFQEAFNRDPKFPRVRSSLPLHGTIDAYFEGKVCIGRRPITYDIQNNKKVQSYLPFIAPSEDPYWMASLCSIDVDRREVFVKVFYFIHNEQTLI
ncbi:hypothetical protein chiPu_0015683 [Chiloscyllium punctatum]|uniref:Uncharacterized protein n=1 Tax=Chiloscyllium punctatum TaxID=137246 RepID=A0A401T3G0_CHIPU|nr:hypothetical protein [Chiloscyllium punctatum]